MIFGGIITWFIKSKSENLKAIEENLRIDRRKLYIDILEPSMKIFADIKGQGPEEAMKQIKSYEYRKTSFELNLIGSDNVVKAYNNFMQHIYKCSESNKQNPKEMMRLFGKFLLEIRKSLGNKKTKLNPYDMLKSFITDIEEIEKS